MARGGRPELTVRALQPVVAGLRELGHPVDALLEELATLWFGTTTLGLRRILQGDRVSHREWMVRSYALSFFFVTFSLWVPGLALTGLPEEIGYPLGVFLSRGPNLVVAESLIRMGRLRTLRCASS